VEATAEKTFKASIPDLPLDDEFGRELLETQCTKCTRTLYYARDFLDILRIRKHRPYCLPCQHPDRYVWDAGIDQYGPREFIVPRSTIRKGKVLTHVKVNLPGDEEALELKQVELDLTGLYHRKTQLTESIEKFQSLLAEVEAVIAEKEGRVPELRETVKREFADPNREKRGLLSELKREIRRLERELDHE